MSATVCMAEDRLEPILHPSRRTFSWLWVACILVLALCLRLYRIGHDSFWIDEVFSVRVASQPPGQILLNYRPSLLDGGGAEQAPLAFFVMHFFLADQLSEVYARLPAAIFGTADVGVLLLVARYLVPAPVALLAAFLLALAPLHVWYSQEARYYAQWAFLTTASYWALLRAVDTRRHRWAWAGYWLATALSLYTFILSFFVMFCQAISAWRLQRLRPGQHVLRNCIGVQLLATISAAPVIWMIVNTLGRTTGAIRTKQLAAVPYTFFAYAAGYTSGPTVASLHSQPSVSRILTDYPVVILFGLVFVPLIVLGVRRAMREPIAAAVVLPWCFGPSVLMFVTSLASNVGFQTRYAVVALPAFVLVVALGALAIRTAPLRWIATSAVTVCYLFSLANSYWNPQYDKEDARQAVARLQSAGFNDAPVVVIGDVWPAVAHYGPQLRVLKFISCDGEFDQARVFALDEASTVWLVAGRDWFQEAPRCLQRLSRHRATIARDSVQGIDLWLLQRRDAAPSDRGVG